MSPWLFPLETRNYHFRLWDVTSGENPHNPLFLLSLVVEWARRMVKSCNWVEEAALYKTRSLQLPNIAVL